MEILIVLVGSFLLALVFLKIIKKQWLLLLAGRIGLSIMLLFTSIGHFIYPEGMALMLPAFLPLKTELIYATGIIELAGAAGLLIPAFQRWTAWLLILFFIMILPANIYAAMQHVNLKTATNDGYGPAYLWFRIPLQFFLIAWTYTFGIINSGNNFSFKFFSHEKGNHFT